MKKLLSLVAALSLLLSLALTTAPALAADEPFVITIMAPFYNEAPPKGSTLAEGKTQPALKALEEATGVSLDITWTPQGDYATKFNTVMAGSDLPMVIALSSGMATNPAFLKYCQNDVFWDLTDKLPKYPTLASVLTDKVHLDVTAVGGRNYMIPSLTEVARVGLIYRADWAEKLGIAPPTTADEVFQMAMRFTTEDPDGDGQNNTIGFAYIDDADKELTYAGFDTLAVALGAPNRFGIVDGVYVPYFETQAYMDTLDFFKDMYDSGYMNQDFALIKGNDKYNPILQETAGFMFTSAVNSAYPGGKYDTLMNEVNPQAKLAYTMLMTNPDGQQVTNSTLSPNGIGGLVIPKASVKTEEELDRILQFFDDAQNEEKPGAKIANLGVEGLHYSVEGGSITISDAQRALRAEDDTTDIFINTIARRLIAPDFGQPRSPADIIRIACYENMPYAVQDASAGKLSADTLSLQSSIATIISDARVKYIMGQIDEAGFTAAVQEWRAQGGDAILAELNAQP